MTRFLSLSENVSREKSAGAEYLGLTAQKLHKVTRVKQHRYSVLQHKTSNSTYFLTLEFVFLHPKGAKIAKQSILVACPFLLTWNQKSSYNSSKMLLSNELVWLKLAAGAGRMSEENVFNLYLKLRSNYVNNLTLSPTLLPATRGSSKSFVNTSEQMCPLQFVQRQWSWTVDVFSDTNSPSFSWTDFTSITWKCSLIIKLSVW